MRIINVIECFSGTVESIESFAVYEEQLSQDVVENAEKCFKEKAIRMGANENDLDVCLRMDGLYFGKKMSVCIIWTDV